MNTPAIDSILSELLQAAELDSPEWQRVEQAEREIQGLKKRLEAIKEAHDAASEALYHMQFVRLEEVLNYCINLKEHIRSLGHEAPEPQDFACTPPQAP